MSDRKNIHKLQSAMSHTLDIVDTILSVLQKTQNTFNSTELELIDECKEVMKGVKERWYPVCSDALSEEDRNESTEL